MSAVHEISVGFREATAQFADESLAELIIKGNNDFDSLTEVERLRIIVPASGLFRAWEEAFIQHQERRLDDRNWNTMVRYYHTITNMECMQRVWAHRHQNYDEEFQSFVNNLDQGTYQLKDM